MGEQSCGKSFDGSAMRYVDGVWMSLGRQEDIVREFQSKFSQLISEEGKDNFISRMYKGRLDIIPWSMFNDAGCFKTLSNVNKDLENAKYENARTFLQNTKLIMAKLKLHINSRRNIKGLLSFTVSYGLEQKSPDLTSQKSTSELTSNRFFRHIVELRIALVTNWYGQNTTNFPQNNSDIVNGRFAIE
ncbi:5823_t:CDS:2 [Funneliformis caledonium]|uniref:5823_t:CDS:1 n=1 Tax=Funneliformis caledonium TaxID=1117310 RepID=A0A9N9D4N0_9GLOM|nr:5823_t:CDS:2 [Funneliformis caledonium]